MTKCKIEISQRKDFTNTSDAKNYLRGLVDAGILFITVTRRSEETRISVNEISYYKTVAEAKIDLKNFVDAGILYLKVDRDDR